MDIKEFRDEVIDDIHFNASINGTSPREEFLAMYADVLVDAEEFEDFEQIPFEGVGPRNRKIQIDGYFYSNLENCLGIILCLFTDSLEIQSLTASEADNQFRHAIAYVEESRSGFIQKYAEESSPGYGLAIDIKDKYSTVQKIKFYLLTDMVMSNRIKEISSTKIGNSVAEYHIWDIYRLQALQESKTGKEDIVINLKELTGKGIPCLEAGSNDEYTAYLCNIPGSVLADLYNKYGGRLLEGNVRSFLTAKGKINKEIRTTIITQPEMFFAYNNGIAATASDVKVEYGGVCPYITEITELQIVNGGQTTASLAAAARDDKDKVNGLKGIYVPMKLSVVSIEKAMTLIPNIAKYANKQNKVSDADFFSNHAFHIRMEECSRRVLAPAVKGNQYGTHWYYERARGQYKQEMAGKTKTQKDEFLLKNPKQQMFNKTDLAKYYNLYRQLPWQVCKGAQKNFLEFADWASKAWDKDSDRFNDGFFRRIVCLDILYKKTDSIVKYADWYEMGYKAQVVAYTIAYLFYGIKNFYPGYALDFRWIWNHQDITSATESLLGNIAERMYSHLVSPKREVENVTEWAKRELCWQKAQEIKIDFGRDFIRELISENEEKSESLADKKDQKITNEVTVMMSVANYGVDRWKALLDWGRNNGVFTSQEMSFLNAAIAIEKGKFPSDKQCTKIMQILEKARNEGYSD